MFWVGLIITLALASQSNGACNTCTEHNVMCVSSTEYQYCVYSTGAAIGDSYSCGSGEICSVAATSTPAAPCAEAVEFLEPDCTCGWCSDLNYACVSETQLELCLDGSTPNLPLITCPSGTNCDFRFSSGNYCAANAESSCSTETVSSDTTTTAATTTAATTTSTTAATTTTATTASTTTVSSAFSCSEAGRFALTGTECQSYATCVLFTNGTWAQYTYICVTGNYFNPSTKRCSSTYVCTE